MNLSLSDKTRIEMQFDNFCKVVITNELRNIRKHNSYILRHEKLFCDLSKNEINSLCLLDKYKIISNVMPAAGFLLEIEDEELFQAIRTLPKNKRDIIMLSYWLDMTDLQISQVLNIVRRTVSYLRSNSLRQLKKYLENK